MESADGGARPSSRSSVSIPVAEPPNACCSSSRGSHSSSSSSSHSTTSAAEDGNRTTEERSLVGPVPDEADVVILGGGPAGLACTLLLAGKGVETLVFDLNTEPVVNSRAHVLDAQSVLILESLGVPVLRHGHPIIGTVLNVNGKDIISSRLPGPGHISLEQSVLEDLLLEQLTLKGIQVHRPIAGYRIDLPAGDGSGIDPMFISTEILAAPPEQHVNTPLITPRPSTVYHPCNVYLTILDAYGNAVRCSTDVVRCRFILGADGARSTVRRALGIEMEARGPQAEYLMADVVVEWGSLMSTDSIYIRQTEHGALTAIPLDSGQNWRIACVREGITEQAAARPPYSRLQGAIPDAAELHQILTVLVPGTTLHRVTWAAAFSLEPALATRFRRGSAILLGDAAHLLCPLLSPSLNLGIQDAMALAWRVAAATRGAAAKTLLDSYDIERRAAAAAALETSTALLSKLLHARAASRAMLTLMAPLMAGNAFVAKTLEKLIITPVVAVASSPAVAPNMLKCSLVPGKTLPYFPMMEVYPRKAPVEALSQVGWALGNYTLLCVLRVLPQGTKVRTWFGCERGEIAMRWNGPIIASVSRFARLVVEALRPVNSVKVSKAEEPLRLVWVLSGLVNTMTNTMGSAENTIAETVPLRLTQVFNHIGEHLNVQSAVCVDYSDALSQLCGIKLAEPYHVDGAKKSSCFLLVRPDGAVAANGYAGDAAAVGGALEYITRMQQP